MFGGRGRLIGSDDESSGLSGYASREARDSLLGFFVPTTSEWKDVYRQRGIIADLPALKQRIEAAEQRFGQIDAIRSNVSTLWTVVQTEFPRVRDLANTAKSRADTAFANAKDALDGLRALRPDVRQFVECSIKRTMNKVRTVQEFIGDGLEVTGRDGNTFLARIRDFQIPTLSEIRTNLGGISMLGGEILRISTTKGSPDGVLVLILMPPPHGLGDRQRVRIERHPDV